MKVFKVYLNDISRRRLQSNKSWFLKQLWGNRRNYSEAICKIARQSFESVTNLNPSLLTPKKDFGISFPENETHSRQILEEETFNRPCNVIYNNEIFQRDSEQAISHQFRKRNQETVRQKQTIPIVKRLSKARKPLAEKTSRKNVKNLECRTRSGKVYSPL